MNPNVRWVKPHAAFTMVLFMSLNSIAAHPAWSAESAKPDSCTASEYRQLDFWIGDWDVFDIDSPAKQVARIHVDRILDGCVLREDYQDTDGHKGQSFSIYDASREVWHQSWGTNRGQLLQLGGQLQASEMFLKAVERTTDGKEKQIRGTWKHAEGGVREAAVTSMDGEEPGTHGSAFYSGPMTPRTRPSRTTRRPSQRSIRNTKQRSKRMTQPPWIASWQTISSS